MKIIIFMFSIFLLSGVALAGVEYLSQDEVHILRTEGGLYDDPPVKLPFEKYYANMQPVIDKIERGIQQTPDDPNWWFYRTRAFGELVGLRQSELISQGAKRGEPDSKENEYRKQMYASLNKFISLDNDDAPKVDAVKYALLDSLYSDKQRLIVYPRILKSPPYGESSDSRVRDYMDYAATYIRLGQFDEAVDVLESMSSDKYIQMMQQDTGEFSNAWIDGQISVVKKMQQDSYAQADTYTAPKAAVVQQPAQQTVEPKKAEASQAADKTPASESNSMLWWLFGGGALLLGLIVLLRRKKG